MSGGPVFHQLAYATCPYLLNYPDAAGAAGRVLRPEVAAALARRLARRPHLHIPDPARVPVLAAFGSGRDGRDVQGHDRARALGQVRDGGKPEPRRGAASRRRRRDGVRRREGDAHPRHHGAGRHAHDPPDARRGRPPRPARARRSSALSRWGRRPCRAEAGRHPSPWRAPTASRRPATARSFWSGTRTTPATGRAGSRASSTRMGSREAEAISRVEHGRADYVTGRTVATTRRARSRPAARSTPATASRAGPGGRATRATCRARSRGSTRSHSTRTGRSSAMRACGVPRHTRSIAGPSRRSSPSGLPTASFPRPSPGRAANIAYGDEPDLAAARRLAGQRNAAQGDPLLLRPIPTTSASRRSSARTSPRSGSTCASTNRSGA